MAPTMTRTSAELKTAYINQTGQSQFTGFYSQTWRCRAPNLQPLCPKDEIHFLATPLEASKILASKCHCGADFIPLEQRKVHPLIQKISQNFPDETDRIKLIAEHIGDIPTEEFRGFKSLIDWELAKEPVLLCNSCHKYIVDKSEINNLVENKHNECGLCRKPVDLNSVEVDETLKDINRRFIDGLPNEIPKIASPFYTPPEQKKSLYRACFALTALTIAVAVVAIVGLTAIFGVGWIRNVVDRMMQYRRLIR